MDIPKTLYWLVFGCIFLCASYLQYKGYQAFGMAILFFLGMFHVIIFHIAEKSLPPKGTHHYGADHEIASVGATLFYFTYLAAQMEVLADVES